MKKVAVVLAGCGHLDGSEIREAVCAIMALESLNISFQCFAPNINCNTIDHIDKSSVGTRNIFNESARIARGDILPLEDLKAEMFDGLIIPGGYGVVNNLSDFAKEGVNAAILPILKNIIIDFFKHKKPIGAICIAPVIIALVLGKMGKKKNLMLTLGEDSNANIINDLGCTHVTSQSTEFVKDKVYNIFSTSAYMKKAKLNSIYQGIFNMIEAMNGI